MSNYNNVVLFWLIGLDPGATKKKKQCCHSVISRSLLRKNNHCTSFSNHKIPISIFGAYLMSDMSKNITARPINTNIFENREKRCKIICKIIQGFQFKKRSSLLYHVTYDRNCFYNYI